MSGRPISAVKRTPFVYPSSIPRCSQPTTSPTNSTSALSQCLCGHCLANANRRSVFIGAEQNVADGAEVHERRHAVSTDDDVRPAKDTTRADHLRAEIANLEKEMAESQRALAELEATMRAVETRAMEAIRDGNDSAARAEFLELGSHGEKAAALNADLKVLRAILDECYDFLNKMSEDPRSRVPGG